MAFVRRPKTLPSLVLQTKLEKLKTMFFSNENKNKLERIQAFMTKISHLKENLVTNYDAKEIARLQSNTSFNASQILSELKKTKEAAITTCIIDLQNLLTTNGSIQLFDIDKTKVAQCGVIVLYGTIIKALTKEIDSLKAAAIQPTESKELHMKEQKGREESGTKQTKINGTRNSDCLSARPNPASEPLRPALARSFSR